MLLGLVAGISGLAGAQAPAPDGGEPAPAVIAQAYLYVEPFQARVEVLFDAATVLGWQSSQPAPATLTAAQQTTLTEDVARIAADWVTLHSGTQSLPGNFIGAAIIKGKPGATLPFEEGAEIKVPEAMVGLTWEFPIASKPAQLTLAWHAFEAFPHATKIPVTIFFGTRPEHLELAQDQPPAVWVSRGRIPDPPPLSAVPPATIAPSYWRWLGVGWLAMGLLALIILAVKLGPKSTVTGIAVILWLAGGSTFLVLDKLSRSKSRVASPQQAEAILRPLLRNVYRAFDHRAEEEIYDVLARSVSGDLLRTLYLETIEALTLEGREGTRVTINDFDATVAAVRPAGHGAFTADCQWTALGRVGHWGHTHTRVNRYNAQVTVTAEAGDTGPHTWKITGLQVTEARRM